MKCWEIFKKVHNNTRTTAITPVDDMLNQCVDEIEDTQHLIPWCHIMKPMVTFRLLDIGDHGYKHQRDSVQYCCNQRSYSQPSWNKLNTYQKKMFKKDIVLRHESYKFHVSFYIYRRPKKAKRLAYLLFFWLLLLRLFFVEKNLWVGFIQSFFSPTRNWRKQMTKWKKTTLCDGAHKKDKLGLARLQKDAKSLMQYL